MKKPPSKRMALSSSYGSWQQGPAVSHLHAAHARSEHREDCGLSQLAFEMEMDSESDCSILSCRTASTSSSSTMTSESESEEGKSENHGTYFSMEFDQHLSALDTKIDLEEDDASCLRRPRTGGHSGIASNSDSIDSAPFYARLHGSHPSRGASCESSQLVGSHVKEQMRRDLRCGHTPFCTGLHTNKWQGS